MGPEEAKLTKWFEQKRKEGMVDFKVTLAPAASFASREELCKDINSFNDAVESGKATKIDWVELENQTKEEI